MTKPKKWLSDLHNHLNGSVSWDFLSRTATKNARMDEYNKLVKLKEDYHKLAAEQPEEGFAKNVITLIWQQFEFIHQIIQDLSDIYEAVLDVVENTVAEYIEIRTTPKKLKGESRDKYIDTFVAALNKANETIKDKQAFGLLSLDRTVHTLADAEQFIHRIRENRAVLHGLDISGNPAAARTLTGDQLHDVVLLALNSDIPIAVHMAETKSKIEEDDTDCVLMALEQWKLKQPAQVKNLFEGKVRLGHCIYLTEQQQKKIAELQIPIEICPTCHSRLNWHLEKDPHPVRGVYDDISDPVTIGTDDETLFSATAETEVRHGIGFFHNRKGLTEEQIMVHQAKYRF
ncbi:amidohydrolase family protein [Legionella dresdenensis]|uniref:Amidohydrolase family protein n=1 Tax=Legionella dresdenensis TaxID=450200 RepID=A0ABV8CGW3_9GAMM